MPACSCCTDPACYSSTCSKFWTFWSPRAPLKCPEETEECKTPFWQSKCPLPPIEPGAADSCPFKPLLKIGLLWIEFLRRLLIPTTWSTSTVVYAKKKEEPKPQCDESHTLVIANQLPLYVDEPPCPKCKPYEPKKTTVLIEGIKTVREQLWDLMDQLEVAKKRASEMLLTAKEHTETTIEYLRDECNFAPRVGAIAVGGLAGYVLALRRGRFKRLLYTTAGAGAMAALCYPREAQQYSETALKNMKKYVIIGYHFVNGVSRDLVGYQLPPLPFSHHLVISDGHHGDAVDAVPPTTHLLPPTASATHIHLHPDQEVKK